MFYLYSATFEEEPTFLFHYIYLKAEVTATLQIQICHSKHDLLIKLSR